MALLSSISGIRGTVGGLPHEGLTPADVVLYTSAYAAFLRQQATASNTVVVGRDARPSGAMIKGLVCSTLQAMGYDVVDIGLAATPTTELAVTLLHAAGGIIITASHNPQQWNALKLLNAEGEFLSADEGQQVLTLADAALAYVPSDKIGTYSEDHTFGDKHLNLILNLPLVSVAEIRAAHLSVAVDVINSVGATIVPALLAALGVEYTLLNGEMTGQFAHNPEPLAENVTGIMSVVANGHYDMGIVVDPDVDRLAFITEEGAMYGEEYTLVSVADYVLAHTPGNTVSNLSSSRALRDITLRHGGHYAASAVGEVNVVAMMKATKAVIGGEGNGGVIYPACHYGRDALVGIALFLSYVAAQKKTLTALRAALPAYHMTKEKITLLPTTDLSAVLAHVKAHFREGQSDERDGVKIDLTDGWVHLRRSNTEPIIRIYCEAPTAARAAALATETMNVINEMV